MTLTPRQESIMLAIQRSIAATGRPPTLDALAKECGLSSKGRMHGYIGELVALGYLERERYGARSIKVLKPIPDDRFEEAARRVCEKLGVATPESIEIARDEIYAALMPEAA